MAQAGDVHEQTVILVPHMDENLDERDGKRIRGGAWTLPSALREWYSQCGDKLKVGLKLGYCDRNSGTIWAGLLRIS